MNVNLFTGSYQGSQQQSSSLPVVPIPSFAVRVPSRQFALNVEGVPPIGPVSYGNGFGGTQSTKLSYANWELTWQTASRRFEIGAGSTLINQITYYHRSIVDQSSRVAGFRISGKIRLERAKSTVSDLQISVSPRMHGVQNTDFTSPFQCARAGFNCGPGSSSEQDFEAASLMDISAQRSHVHRASILFYGLRYLNYVAYFPATGHPADHDVALMPFAGFAVTLGR